MVGLSETDDFAPVFAVCNGGDVHKFKMYVFFDAIIVKFPGPFHAFINMLWLEGKNVETEGGLEKTQEALRIFWNDGKEIILFRDF